MIAYASPVRQGRFVAPPAAGLYWSAFVAGAFGLGSALLCMAHVALTAPASGSMTVGFWALGVAAVSAFVAFVLGLIYAIGAARADFVKGTRGRSLIAMLLSIAGFFAASMAFGVISASQAPQVAAARVPAAPRIAAVPAPLPQPQALGVEQVEISVWNGSLLSVDSLTLKHPTGKAVAFEPIPPNSSVRQWVRLEGTGPVTLEFSHRGATWEQTALESVIDGRARQSGAQLRVDTALAAQAATRSSAERLKPLEMTHESRTKHTRTHLTVTAAGRMDFQMTIHTDGSHATPKPPVFKHAGQLTPAQQAELALALSQWTMWREQPYGDVDTTFPTEILRVRYGDRSLAGLSGWLPPQVNALPHRMEEWGRALPKVE